MNQEIDGKVIHLVHTSTGRKTLTSSIAAVLSQYTVEIQNDIEMQERIEQQERQHRNYVTNLKQDITDRNELMATKGIHRVTPNSKAGRRMINIAKERNPYLGMTKEQADWNKAVDAKKAAKLAAKLNRIQLK